MLDVDMCAYGVLGLVDGLFWYQRLTVQNKPGGSFLLGSSSFLISEWGKRRKQQRNWLSYSLYYQSKPCNCRL